MSSDNDVHLKPMHQRRTSEAVWSSIRLVVPGEESQEGKLVIFCLFIIVKFTETRQDCSYKCDSTTLI